MHSQSFPFHLLFLILIITTLHFLATYFYWYWSIWWFDLLMHFLGGLWIGLGALWFYFSSGRITKPQKTKKRLFFTSLIAVGIIGLLWELFEFSLGQFIVFNPLNSLSDTIGDLTFDIIGSLGATFYFIYHHKFFLINNPNEQTKFKK